MVPALKDPPTTPRPEKDQFRMELPPGSVCALCFAHMLCCSDFSSWGSVQDGAS